LQQHIESRTIAGAVTLVARRGRIAHFEAQGLMDIEAKKVMPKGGIFRLASTSKPITAVASVAGKLAPRAPTDTLATYIPKLAAVPLDFQPGTLWRYSGQAGFDVLSRIVEVVSEQPFDQFLKQRLFDPLGMKDTGFVATGDRAARLATVYRRTPNGLERSENPNALSSTSYFSGAGGLLSTVEDYLQFAQMLENGGQLNGKRFLGPRTVELMASNHTGDMVNGQFGRPARGMGFGLGVQVVQDAVAADLRQSKGTFGWAGAFGTNVNMDFTGTDGNGRLHSESGREWRSSSRLRERCDAGNCGVEELGRVKEGEGGLGRAFPNPPQPLLTLPNPSTYGFSSARAPLRMFVIP
jgi:CubicO group peptidase (beta-lactamase class C family)